MAAPKLVRRRSRRTVRKAIWIRRGHTDPLGKNCALTSEPIVIPYQISMAAVRNRLSWVIAGWLVCQFAGVAAPLTLYAISTASGGHDATCDCPIAPGQACPMHPRMKVIGHARYVTLPVDRKRRCWRRPAASACCRLRRLP